MKKSNFFETFVKIGVVAATVGGALYLLKDKIEEDPKYKEAIDKAKDTLKQYVPKKKNDEEEDFFDEEFEEIIHTSDSDADRGYVKIKLPGEEDEVSEE